MAALTAFVILPVLSAGCGKEGPPKIPEEHAPAPIETISGTGRVDGLQIDWSAPELDASGDELSGLGGFRVMKRLVVKEEKTEFVEVAVVPAKPAYVPGDSYTYLDDKVTGGKVYEYRVVAMDAEEAESLGNKTIRVNFVGENSTVQILPGRREEVF
jgi:hypothetical protein